MKEHLVSILRNRETKIDCFRKAAHQLGSLLAFEVASKLPKKKTSIKTPLGDAQGVVTDLDVVLVPILRAGLSLLNPFLEIFPKASIGCIGAFREHRAQSVHIYYQKIPKTDNKTFIVLDPMLATGKSACASIKLLKEKNSVAEENIFFVGVIASTEGISYIKKNYPKIQLIVAQVDDMLNDNKYIVPGLGDFGDRYFGTVSSTHCNS